MSTAQQLGLIGNSVKVQSLPTASAETFGAGNRFYTLIGQQEGYITGHTYRTVVANDVYSWEDIDGGEETTGDYTVKVIDYDGTVLLEKKGNTGDVINLPTAPTHEKLVFQEWSASVAVSDNKVTIANNDIMVGAVYTTASGQNEFDITLTKVTGLSVKLNMNGTKDWGDGTSNTNMTHTYAACGDYTIKCNGTTMTTSSSSGLFGQGVNARNSYCTEARFATVTRMSDYTFSGCSSLTRVVISSGVTSIGVSAFYECFLLISIVIPSGVTSIGSNAFYGCYSLTSIVIPSGVTSIGSLYACYSLTRVVIPSGVTSIGNYTLSNCYSLTSIVIPSSVTSIGDSPFSYCRSLTKYDFSKCTAVPTLSSKDVFYAINGICKIIVPDSLYDEWIAANNWSTYANYIYKASEVTQ